jgi:hypothetical protein
VKGVLYNGGRNERIRKGVRWRVESKYHVREEGEGCNM